VAIILDEDGSPATGVIVGVPSNSLITLIPDFMNPVGLVGNGVGDFHRGTVVSWNHGHHRLMNRASESSVVSERDFASGRIIVDIEMSGTWVASRAHQIEINSSRRDGRSNFARVAILEGQAETIVRMSCFQLPHGSFAGPETHVGIVAGI